jgi:hypothetical protein
MPGIAMGNMKKFIAKLGRVGKHPQDGEAQAPPAFGVFMTLKIA